MVRESIKNMFFGKNKEEIKTSEEFGMKTELNLNASSSNIQNAVSDNSGTASTFIYSVDKETNKNTEVSHTVFRSLAADYLVNQLSFPKGNAKTIVVASGKGGVGKTFVSSTLASLLALSGKKTLVVDLDTGLRNLDIVMGVENQVNYNIYDVVSGRTHWTKGVFADSRIKGLWYLISDQGRQKESVDEKIFSSLIRELKKYFEYIILDAPAGIESGFNIAAGAADSAIIVTTPEMPAIRGAAQVASILEYRKLAPISIILNRVVPELTGTGGASPEEVTLFTGIPVRGVIPRDDNVIAASHQGVPLALWPRHSPAKEEFATFVKRDFDMEQTKMKIGLR